MAIKDGYVRVVFEVPKSWRQKLKVLSAEAECESMKEYLFMAVDEKYKNDLDKMMRQMK